MSLEQKKFDCKVGCGACCKNVGHLPIPSTDGICDLLVDGLCSIYDERPEICRVDSMFEKYGGGLTWEEWCTLNSGYCRVLLNSGT